jgi:hypothetical protein
VEERGRVDGVQCWRGLVRMGCVCAVAVSLQGRITDADAAVTARVPRRGVANHRARKLGAGSMRRRCGPGATMLWPDTTHAMEVDGGGWWWMVVDGDGGCLPACLAVLPACALTLLALFSHTHPPLCSPTAVQREQRRAEAWMQSHGMG